MLDTIITIMVNMWLVLCHLIQILVLSVYVHDMLAPVLMGSFNRFSYVEHAISV